jgi:hypothetical protein
MSQAEIEYSNVYPKYFSPLCENLSLPVVRGADSIVLTTLPSSTAGSFATQYVIRLNDTMAVSNLMTEQVTFNASVTYTFTGLPAIAIGGNAVYNFTTPFIPAWNSINAIAASYTVTLGSSSFTTPNVSRNCYALATYGYDEEMSKHDYIDAASMPLYARAPALINGGYGVAAADLATYQQKLSTLKGPFVPFQNSTYGFDGNYNDMYGEFNITATATGAGTGTVNVSPISWEYFSATITNSSTTATFTPQSITVIFTWTQRAPLQTGVTALCKKGETIFSNINQVQIQKNPVPNIAENATYQRLKPFAAQTITAAGAGGSPGQAVWSTAANLPAAATIAMSNLTLTAGSCNLYYKTMVFNNTRKYIPETISILSRDYNIFQSQPIGAKLRFGIPNQFTSNTLNLPQVPQRIYIWCGYDTSALTMGSDVAINISNVPQCAIKSVQNISLGGRSICSGLSTDYLVNDVLCSKTYKPLSEFGMARLTTGPRGNPVLDPIAPGFPQVGLSGNVLCLDVENMGLSEDQAAGLSGNSSMTFQFNITIQLLDEYYSGIDLPSNTLQCFILCVSDRVLTFNSGNCSNTTQLFDAAQLRQIRENPAIAMDLSRVMYGAGWWDDFTKGLGSVASKGLDALSWVADNGEKIMKTGEKFLPMLGLGHDDSEAGKRMNKKEELRRLLNR